VIEILANMDVLKRSVLALQELMLDGVAFGAPGRTIDRRKIAEISFSPLVKKSVSGTNIEAEYYDAAGTKLSHDVVIDSVIDANGALHVPANFSYKIVNGVIEGFSLYGPQLAAFGKLESPEAVIAMFGQPDRTRVNVTYGDLMGHDFYYAASRKQVCWDAWDHRIQCITLGDYPIEY
jgi:hypothetical protein